MYLLDPTRVALHEMTNLIRSIFDMLHNRNFADVGYLSHFNIRQHSQTSSRDSSCGVNNLSNSLIAFFPLA